jgi:hypothetical protein
VAACGDSDAGPARADGPVRTASPETAFAPLVYLHPDERWLPASARDFIAESDLIWAGGRVCPGRVVTTEPAASRLGRDGGYRQRPLERPCRGHGPIAYSATDLTRPHSRKGRPAGLPLDQGFYLDVHTDDFRDRRDIRRSASGSDLRDVPVYAERESAWAGGGPAVRITYWMLYAGSLPEASVRVAEALAYEGDWQRVSVLLRDRPGSDDYTPVSVRYHVRDGYRDVPWRDVELVAAEGQDEASHPVVLSALGHAPYPHPGAYAWRVFVAGAERTVRDRPDDCVRCPRWRTWRKVLDAQAQRWHGYGGAWGTPGADSRTTGRLGPAP